MIYTRTGLELKGKRGTVENIMESESVNFAKMEAFSGMKNADTTVVIVVKLTHLTQSVSL